MQFSFPFTIGKDTNTERLQRGRIKDRSVWVTGSSHALNSCFLPWHTRVSLQMLDQSWKSIRKSSIGAQWRDHHLSKRPKRFKTNYTPPHHHSSSFPSQPPQGTGQKRQTSFLNPASPSNLDSPNFSNPKNTPHRSQTKNANPYYKNQSLYSYIYD